MVGIAGERDHPAQRSSPWRPRSRRPFGRKHPPATAPRAPRRVCPRPAGRSLAKLSATCCVRDSSTKRLPSTSSSRTSQPAGIAYPRLRKQPPDQRFSPLAVRDEEACMEVRRRLVLHLGRRSRAPAATRSARGSPSGSGSPAASCSATSPVPCAGQAGSSARCDPCAPAHRYRAALGRSSRRDRGQLPGKVLRVADAAIHALPGKGRVRWRHPRRGYTRPKRQRGATRAWKR